MTHVLVTLIVIAMLVPRCVCVCYCMTFCTCIHCRLLSWNLELEWEIGYKKVADLRAEVRCRYGAHCGENGFHTGTERTSYGALS